MPLGIKHPDTPQQFNICRGSTTESHINGPPSHHHPNLQCHNTCCYKVQISEVEEDLQATCSSFHQRQKTKYSGPIQRSCSQSPTRVKKYVPNVKPSNRRPCKSQKKAAFAASAEQARSALKGSWRRLGEDFTGFGGTNIPVVVTNW